MTATGREVARELLRRGLLEPAEVVDGELLVHEQERRNRVIRVSRAPGRPSYVVKRPAEPGGAATQANEARAYAELGDAEPVLTALLPRVVAHDPDAPLLVLELVEGAESLSAHAERTGRGSTRVAAGLGAGLAALHRRPVAGALPCAEPWALRGHRPPPEVLRTTTEAGLGVIRILQGPELAPALDEVREAWRDDAVIHGDVSWQNVLVAPAPDGREEPRVALVDWELSGRGDPRWDIGSALAGYLSFWLFTREGAGGSGPGVPLEALIPAIADCWAVYADGMGLAPAARPERLLQVARFCAARLGQIAFEAAETTATLSAPVVLHLQVAANMLADPGRAVTDLLQLG